MIWLIFALVCALAGGILAGIQRAWAVVLVALAVVFLTLPRLV